MDIDSSSTTADAARSESTTQSARPSRRAAAVAAAAVTAQDPALALEDSDDEEEDDGDYQSASDGDDESGGSSGEDDEEEDGDADQEAEEGGSGSDEPRSPADDAEKSSSKKRKSDDSESANRKKKRRDKKKEKKEKKNKKHKKDKKEKEKSSKKRKSDGRHLIDDEAELSGSDDGSQGSASGSEAADEALDTYVPDGFVVMDGEASSGEESGDEKKPKKKVFSRLRRNKGEMQMVEDDLALIEENAGRMKSTSGAISKKAASGEIAPERVYQEGDAEEEGSDAEAGGEAKAARAGRRDEEEDDEDDLDSFLVDDLAEEGEEGEGDEEAAEAARKRRQEQRRRPASERRYVDGPTREEMEEAIDIFGEGAEEYLYGGGEESDGEYAEAAEEGSDDGLFGDARARKKRAKKAASVADGLDMRSMFERKKLVEKFCTEADDVIRNTDLPERFQDALMNRAVPDVSERREEARWMAVKLADKIVKEYGRESKIPEKYGPRTALETALQEPIETVLTLFHVEKYEAPFIWAYRKDYLHDLMTKKHVWWILHQDVKWEDIIHRRRHLLSEIQLVVSVATEQIEDGNSGSSVEALSARLIEVEKEAERLNDLRAEVQEAYDAALDATDQGEDVSSKDRAKVTAAAAALEEVTRNLEQNAEELDRVKTELSEARRRYRLRSSVPRAMALEFLKLFPVDKYESILKSLTDDLELRDVQNFCSMLLNSSGGKNKKRLRGRNAGSAAYFRARQSNIREYVNAFSRSAADLGRSLKYGRDRANPPTPDEDIQTFAASFVSERYPTSSEVHSAGVELLMHEVANEPSVKQYLRKYYRSKAHITTRPTKKGIEVIHPFHELFGLHYLDIKPVIDFFDANCVDNSFVGGSDRTAFARLIKAEKEGLITIKLEGPRRLESYVLDCFSSDTRNRNNIQRAWDDERESIVESAYKTLLVPFFEHETRRELLRLAKDAIIEEATDTYAKLVSAGPFRPQRVKFQDAVENTPFKACFFSAACIFLPADTGRDSTVFMSFVDRDGLVRAQDSIPYEARNQKRTKIRDFLKMTKPEVIVVNSGAGSLSLSTQSLIEAFLVKEVNEMLDAEAAARRRSRRHSEYYNGDDEDDEDAKKFEPEVVLVKDEVAQIFGVSSRAKALFPGSPPGAAAAVCLARFVQEPVAEYANMWRSANEINIFGYETLFLDLHPLQSLLSEVKAPFLSSLECVIVDAVCEIGVDLNAAVQHDHLAGMLAFVGGLGLRKAEALRFNIQRQVGAVTSRRQLIERKLLGKVVYKNAAGFLRICDTGTQDALLDPLDDTRIHPECYVMSDFATKMCASALEVDHNAEDYIENVTRQMQQCKRAFEQRLAQERSNHERENPYESSTEKERYYSNWMVATERAILRSAAPNANCATAGADLFALYDSLEELNLEDYAEELVSQGAGKRYKQLCHIKAELRFPWLDRRTPLPALTDSEKFTIASGETDSTLYIGQRVTCKINVVKENSALVIVNDNLKGWVSRANISDNHFEKASDVITEGSFVEGVVIKIVKDQRRVEVSLKRSMVEYGEHKWYKERTESGSYASDWWRDSGRPSHFDPCFDVKHALQAYEDHEIQREAALKEAKLATAKGSGDRNSGSAGLKASGAMARQIYHPLFRNCGFAEAEAELRGRGPGEVIFRPSSKSNDTLSITWAFQDGWFKHIDVQEFDKKGGPQSIGSRLLIKGEKEEFSDLDEIMSRYITPMNDLVAKMIAHRSFKLGSVEDCNEFMRASYQSGQSTGHRQIPYLVRFDPNHPGYFVLAWFVVESVNNPFKSEYIGVTPEGYKLRDKVFKTPSELINFFKANASRAAGGGGGSNLGQSSNSNRSRLPPPPSVAQQVPPPQKRSRWN